MEIPKAESEKGIRGSREAFTEDLDTNIELIKKRLKDERLMQVCTSLGRRTKTKTQIVYIEDIAYDEIVSRIKDRLQKIEEQVDGVLDSGTAEQLIKENVWSPFPLYQATERPDRVCQSLLEGRVAVLLDHSPEALLLPATVDTLFQTSDDYYRHFEVVSFLRIVRIAAAFLAVFLPGIYVAVNCFHSQILPTALVVSMAEAREGVPFPVMAEVLFLEIAFELIREAGLRMPGAIGNTIGIVGGLIVGQSAVSADLVSPMTVVVVALTALGSFSVPNEEFSEALRLVKYVYIILGGFLGIVGIIFGAYLLILHLASLKSFGIPYLSPYTGAEKNQYFDLRDSMVRFPLRTLWKRPVYARRQQRVRMKWEEK
ncbi:MAG: spore germination protein [Eubacteriales bacterium]|nr:spore germination protein [Eubacteriales bacterium]